MPLPTPAKLVVENVTLLAGGPGAFHARYGVQVNTSSFTRPGNTTAALPLLHFLLSAIDSDDTLFKPCFPILDRAQERDFRAAVETRLAALERRALLPVGSSRKSVVAAAGGPRFEDLVWALSTLAVQRACLRPDAKQRLVSAVPTPAVGATRRFLNGMSSSASSAYVAQVRTRIAAERAVFARTAELGKESQARWADEAAVLRNRIAEFQARMTSLRKELEELGFDEGGVDVRARLAEELGAVSSPAASPREQSDSGVEASSSPIGSVASEERAEVDRDDCGPPSVEGLASDVARLLAVSGGSKELRDGLSKILDARTPQKQKTLDFVSARNRAGGKFPPVVSSPITPALSPSQQDGNTTEQEEVDVVDIVRYAIAELDEATARLETISARRIEEQKGLAGKESVKSHVDDSPGVLVEKVTALSVEESRADKCQLEELVGDSLPKHKAIVESARKLSGAALALEEQAAAKTPQKDKSVLRGVGADDSTSTDKMNESPTPQTPAPKWIGDVEKCSVVDEFDDDAVFAAESPDAYTKGNGGEPVPDAESEDTARSGLASRIDFFSAVDELRVVKDVLKKSPLSTKSASSESESTPTAASPLEQTSLPLEQSSQTSPSSYMGHSASAVPGVSILYTPGVPRSPAKVSKCVRFATLPPSYTASKTSAMGGKVLREPPPRENAAGVVCEPLLDTLDLTLDDDAEVFPRSQSPPAETTPGASRNAFGAKTNIDSRESEKTSAGSPNYTGRPFSRLGGRRPTPRRIGRRVAQATRTVQEPSVPVAAFSPTEFGDAATPKGESLPTLRDVARCVGHGEGAAVRSVSADSIPVDVIRMQNQTMETSTEEYHLARQSFALGSVTTPGGGAFKRAGSQSSNSSGARTSQLLSMTPQERKSDRRAPGAKLQKRLFSTPNERLGRASSYHGEEGGDGSAPSSDEKSSTLRRTLSGTVAAWVSPKLKNKQRDGNPRVVAFQSPFASRNTTSSVLLSSHDEDGLDGVGDIDLEDLDDCDLLYSPKAQTPKSEPERILVQEQGTERPEKLHGVLSGFRRSPRSSPNAPHSTTSPRSASASPESANAKRSDWSQPVNESTPTSPGKKSRVKSLRARLAALL